MGNIKGGFNNELKPDLQLEGLEGKKHTDPGASDETNHGPGHDFEVIGETEGDTNEGYTAVNEKRQKPELDTPEGEGTTHKVLDKCWVNNTITTSGSTNQTENTPVAPKPESQRQPYVPRGLVYDSKSEDFVPNERASQISIKSLNRAYTPKGLVWDTKEDELVPERDFKDENDDAVEGGDDYKPKGLVYDPLVKDMIPDDQPRFSLKNIKKTEVSNFI